MIFQKLSKFLEEVKAETKKITWPARKDAATGAVGVIIFVLIISFFLGLVDLGLSKIVSKLIQ